MEYSEDKNLQVDKINNENSNINYDINEMREKIDEIDNGIIDLFQKRMKVASGIADYKKKKGLPVYDATRERQKLSDVVSKADEDMTSYVRTLFTSLFEISKSYQTSLNKEESKLISSINQAIENTPKIFPKNLTIACQGVEGAYSQHACDKMFGMPNIMYFSSFEGVFAAIDKGLCRYGVLPLENSTAGSVNKIYDLMMKYKFSIIRSTRLKIDHNLLAKKGTKKEDIREIFSHEQAINQCAEYLKEFKNAKITVCANTAAAAKMVSESDRDDVAAISSRTCVELYGLTCVDDSIQDKGNNYTRFICISKNIEIYPGADRTSVMMILPHKPGALYDILARFYALGINLVKLESRPIPDRDFEFMFYFDIETSVYSNEFIQLINEMDYLSEKFRYLGSYSELV